jgi:CYTH domain-containing protein
MLYIMGKEIERKFLVNDKIHELLPKLSSSYCCQTYLASDGDKVVRARILGEKGYLTIKSKVVGISRHEFEYEIPLADAKKMIELFGEQVIEKTRYLIPTENHLWEIDVFEGKNKGLIVAEIELTSEEDQFETPTWISEEVSGEAKYYNNNLQENPYSDWK